MKYSWKGREDRNRRQEQNKKEWASSVSLCQKTQTLTSSPHEAEPARTMKIAFSIKTKLTLTIWFQSLYLKKVTEDWIKNEEVGYWRLNKGWRSIKTKLTLTIWFRSLYLKQVTEDWIRDEEVGYWRLDKEWRSRLLKTEPPLTIALVCLPLPSFRSLWPVVLHTCCRPVHSPPKCLQQRKCCMNI